MFIAKILRYKKMVFASLFFFYLGCGLTLSLLRVECSESRVAESNSGLDQTTVASERRVEAVEYIALIISAPDNEKRRDAIRMTWMTLADNIITENGERLYRWNHTRSSSLPRRASFVKSVFAVGTQGLDLSTVRRLESESARTGDLLLLDNVEDSYSKLTHKLAVSLHWLDKHARQLKYVVKCDDDSFVRLDLIVSELEARGHDVGSEQVKTQKREKENYLGLYWGYFDGNAPVFHSGQWKELDWFLCDNYLPYALGGGYVISRSIVSYVAANSHLLKHHKSEDVTIGLWTAALSGINRVHDIRFDTEWKSRGCHDNMLVRHKQTPSDMFAMYSTLVQSRGKNLCKKQTTHRKSYLYDWNVLPSMCCRL